MLRPLLRVQAVVAVSICAEWGGGPGGCGPYDLSRYPLHSMLNAQAIWMIVVPVRCFAVICAVVAPVI
jgi:hypothetical protein